MGRGREKLILFDIDDTLIRTTKAHIDSFSMAFRRVFGVKTTIDIIDHHAKTDKRIIIEVLEKVGIERKEIHQKLGECMRVMVEYFSEAIEEEGVIILEGVLELLEELKDRGHILGIVTGNLKPIADIKLSKTGLKKYFEVGAFGSESLERAELVRLAIRRAEEKFDLKLATNDVFLIGESPRDVESAKKNRVKIIAPTTGKYDEEELRKAGADFIVESLKERNKILKIISSV